MKCEIKKVNGVNTLVVDGTPLDTLSFKSFRPQERNVTDFFNAGVRIFNINCSGIISALKSPYSLFGPVWVGENEYDFSALDRQIEMFEKYAHGSYYILNIHLDMPKWYMEKYPDKPNSFTHISQVCGDEKWLTDTANYLKAIIAHAEEKYNDKILGYFMLGGHTTEWFSDYDYQEANDIKLKAYKKYRNDENAEIPPRSVLEADSKKSFLNPEDDAEIITYQKFHNKLISDTVLYFAKEAQSVLKHQKPLGLFFGYILELLDERLWNAGHIDIDRVYKSPDIDFLATPSSYQFRDYKDAGAYMLMCDTLEHDGLFYFISFDLMTFAVNKVYEEKKAINPNDEFVVALDLLKPMRHNRDDILKNPKEVRDVMQREFMQRMAKRCGHWWFDMMGGWFYNDEVMAIIKELIEVSGKTLDTPRKSASEIAVFISCESFYYVNKMCSLNTELICNQRDGLARLGAPYDMFSLNDLADIDTSQYKLFIFLDAFYLTKEQRKAINSLKCNGNNLLFMRACDFVTDKCLSADSMQKMLEMSIEAVADEDKIIAFNTEYGHKHTTDHMFAVCDTDAEILGTYKESGKGALARKKLDGYTVWFSGLGNLKAGILREIAVLSGVHIYSYGDTATFINSAFLGIYEPSKPSVTLFMKSDGTYVDAFTDTAYTTVDKKIVIPTDKNASCMLLLK